MRVKKLLQGRKFRISKNDYNFLHYWIGIQTLCWLNIIVTFFLAETTIEYIIGLSLGIGVRIFAEYKLSFITVMETKGE